MRRRGNKSNKVPNVKLRPAQEGSMRRESPVGSCWVEDTQAASDDTSILDTCPRPFKGVIVCATGVTDKPTLFKQALELGALAVSAFTDKVTHLIAVDHGGAKYTCALERKIPIMKPSWITESYQVWLRGDDVHYEDSIRTHRLPIFSGVILCPSGIQDITRRTQIHKLITQHEGQYLKNLERPIKVTHLLCSGDEVTEKMRYAEKFNERGEARIYLVWEEWFWDSLDFGGRFEEGRYAVSRPRPERKVLGMYSTNPSQASFVPAPPKPQTTTINDDDSLLDEEMASVNVVPAVTMKVWTSLLGRRGYEIADGQVVLSPTKETGKKFVEQERPASPTAAQGRRKGKGKDSGVISAFRRANSFAPATTDAAKARSNLPFRRTATTTSLFAAAAGDVPFPEKIGEGSNTATTGFGAEEEHPKKIFEGLRFRAFGEAKSASVRGAIEQCGGRWEMDDEDEEHVDFVIVRLVSGSKLYRAELDPSLKLKYRTECWLERCIFEDRVCPPEDHISFVPLGIEMPIRGAERIVMSISGFGESEAVGIKRLIRGLGITLAGSFSRKSTHLLCQCGVGLKFEKAKEWGVPVISVEWLAEMTRSGIIPGVAGYEVGPGGVPVDNSMGKEKGKNKEVDYKGKGKAKAVDHDAAMDVDVDVDVAGRITDITNTAPSRKRPTLALERQSTIILPDVRPPREGLHGSSTFSFGQPNESLLPAESSIYYNHPSSVRTPEFSPVIQYGSRHPSAAPSVQPSVANMNALSRNPTLQEVGSSRSPSPMKLRAGSTALSIGSRTPVKRQGTRLSLSPVKIDTEATRALQESITSLLGKRQIDGEGEGSKGGRENGKRARSSRSRVQSRQTSEISVSDISSVPAPPPLERTSSINPFDTSFDESGSKERSVRVMYEDPAQANERQRLMDLLKDRASVSVNNGKEKEKEKKGTRRSSRLSGSV
ncbi:hypothetical protein BDQ17DRAFT_1237797 [Cyathus striatus]|nr:hypothetical protein BDQ17DRAFT_1237797 [Cyathus striatus]